MSQTALLQTVATALTIISAWMIGNKNRWAFVVFGAANVLWFVWGFAVDAYGVVLSNVVFLAVNVRNYRRWRIE